MKLCLCVFYFFYQKSVSAEVVPAHQKQVAVSPKRDVVKSTAVVKWSATQFPLQFSQLSMNTNLNDAPANWLRSESREEQHLRDLPWQRHHSECSRLELWMLGNLSIFC